MLSLYSSEPSWMHRITPGPKLLVVIATTLGLLAWPGLSPLALLLTLLLYLSIGRLSALSSLKPLWPLLCLMLVFDLWQNGPLSAVLLVSRLLSLMLLANLISLTNSMQALMASLEPVLLPLRRLGVNTHKFGFTLALLFRFVPLLLALIQQLQQSWRCRLGHRFGQWRLIIPLAIQTILLSERVADALAARGGLSARYGQQNNRQRPPLCHSHSTTTSSETPYER